MALATHPPVQIALTHNILGRRALFISGALPFEREACLAVADSVLQRGASVRFIVPLPASGLAERSSEAAAESDLMLLQMISRVGFPQLMEALGFHWGVAGQYGTGNRPRVDFAHVRADDVEAFLLRIHQNVPKLGVDPERRALDSVL